MLGNVDANGNRTNRKRTTEDETEQRSCYGETLRRFDQAIAAYKAQADPLTLLLLNKSAIPLMDVQEHAWQSIDNPDVLDPEHPFTAIRALCDRHLDDAQVDQLSGCLGYALQAILAGPELSLPSAVRLEAPAGSGVRAAFTLVEFAYDARRSCIVFAIAPVSGQASEATEAHVGIRQQCSGACEGLVVRVGDSGF